MFDVGRRIGAHLYIYIYVSFVRIQVRQNEFLNHNARMQLFFGVYPNVFNVDSLCFADCLKNVYRNYFVR